MIANQMSTMLAPCLALSLIFTSTSLARADESVDQNSEQGRDVISTQEAEGSDTKATAKKIPEGLKAVDLTKFRIEPLTAEIDSNGDVKITHGNDH